MAACEKCSWDNTRTPLHVWPVEIAYSMPSQNDLGGNHRNGWVYRRHRSQMAAALKDQLNAIPRAHGFRVGLVTRVYGKGKRQYDYENFVGGCKPLIDTLRDFAVIVDDNPTFWRGHYDQLRSPDGADYLRLSLLEYPP